MSKKREREESDLSDEDLDKELLSLASKRKPKSTSSLPVSDEDSDSSTDDDDDEWTAKSGGKNKKEKKKNVVSEKRSSFADSSSEEEGEINDDDDDSENEEENDSTSSSSEESSDEELPALFDDGLDDDLMGDEEDRKKMSEMTEKEREQELFNRMEKREALKTRREIQNKLLAERKKEDEEELQDQKGEKSSTEVFSETISTRKESRTRLVDNKKKSAMDQLKQKRLKKKEKMDALINKKEPLIMKDVYSDDDEDKENKSVSSDSSDSSSSDEEEVEEDMPLDNLEQLEQVRLSRHKLEQWVHLPFFNEIIVGCFLRMGIGNHDGKAVYRVVEIIGTTEAPKIYLLGNTRTNKGVKVRHGRQERVFRMEYVSNQPFIESEYQKWKDEMKLVELPLPTVKQIKQKCTELSNSINYSLKDADIKAIVLEKNKFRKNPFNYAMKKNDLLMAKAVAEQSENTDEIKNIDKELADLEHRASFLDKQRSGNLGNVSSINQRNRKKNIHDAEKAVIEESKNKSKDLDPFTRRRTVPKMITKGSLEMGRAEKEKSISPNTSAVKTEDISLNDSLVRKKGDSPSNSSGDSDLFNIHDFDVQIDVATFHSPSMPFAPKPAMGQICNGSSRRSLNLDEYKKRKGLI